MKKWAIGIITLIQSIQLHAQGVGINTAGIDADSTAMLDVRSTTKGMLMPRMNTVERMAIINPANGLTVYDTATKSYWYHVDGEGWREMVTGVTSQWELLNLNILNKHQLPVSITDLPGGKEADPSSLLDVFSTSKGILIPRLISAERNAIPAPANGLVVYDRETNSLWYYIDGTGWTEMISAGNNLWKNNGFNIINKDLTPVTVSNISTNAADAMLNVLKLTEDSIHTLPLVSIYRGTTGTPAAGFGSSILFQNQVTGDSSYNHAGIISSIVDEPLSTTDSHTLLFQVFKNGGSAGPQFKLNREAAFVGAQNNRHFLKIFADGTSQSGGLQVSDNTPGNGTIGPSVYYNTSAHDWVTYATNGGAFIGPYKYAIRNVNKSKDYLVIDSLGRVGIGNTAQTVARLYSEHPSTTESAIYGVNADGTAVTGGGITGIKGLSGSGGYAVYGESFGTSPGGYFTSSTGNAGVFEITNASSAAAAVQVFNAGLQTSLNIGAGNNTSVSPAVIINSSTMGRGIFMNLTNATGSGEGIYINKSGPGTGLYVNEESGKAAEFKIVQTANANTAVGISTDGIGMAAEFKTTNTGNIEPVARFQNEGSGIGIKAENNSNPEFYGAVTGINNGNGPGIYGATNATTGTRSAVIGAALGSAGTTYGVKGINRGGAGAGIYGLSDITSTGGRAGLFEMFNNSNAAPVVEIGSLGLGQLLKVYGANTTATTTAFSVAYDGIGSTQFLHSTNAAASSVMNLYRKNGTNDFAVYQDNAGVNKIRFDNTGKGFFNGGTQNSGADLAEAFDINGNKNEYEPGDVLIISVDKDRTVEKSSQPYSALVAGVYATKPGVLLTEENIDTDISGKVPMGVVGVIPTKVCMEGGEIKRGDMLVTSSTAGVAMKADPGKIKPGQVIGKALEAYTGNVVGKIKVLVSIK